MLYLHFVEWQLNLEKDHEIHSEPLFFCHFGSLKILHGRVRNGRYIVLKEPIPDKPPALAEIILQIARMGGYKVQKASAPPGVKSMWLGFQALNIASEMYKNILSIKTCAHRRQLNEVLTKKTIYLRTALYARYPVTNLMRGTNIRFCTSIVLDVADKPRHVGRFS